MPWICLLYTSGEWKEINDTVLFGNRNALIVCLQSSIILAIGKHHALANILYTSGTTGDSKGVMLTYSQYYAALKANNEGIPVTEKDRVIDFLPFTHIFERGWAYLCLSEGAELIINTYPCLLYTSQQWS